MITLYNVDCMHPVDLQAITLIGKNILPTLIFSYSKMPFAKLQGPEISVHTNWKTVPTVCNCAFWRNFWCLDIPVCVLTVVLWYPTQCHQCCTMYETVSLVMQSVISNIWFIVMNENMVSLNDVPLTWIVICYFNSILVVIYFVYFSACEVKINCCSSVSTI